MHGGEDVKERAVWVGCQIQPFRPQSQPGIVMASQKEEAEGESYVQPAPRGGNLSRQAGHESSNTAARYFESKAADDEQKRAEVEDSRQRYVPPIRRRALAHDQGAGERGKRHRNRRDPNPDRAAGRWRRVFLDHPQVPVRGNQVPPAAIARISRFWSRWQTTNFGFWRFVERGCYHF